MPDWVEPVARYMFEVGLPGTLRIAAGALVGSTVIGVVLGTLLTLDFRLVADADPPVHRVLARPADPRHDLHHLLRAAGDHPAARVRRVHSGHRSDSCSGAARRSPRPHAARSGRSRSEQHEAAAALGFGWVGRHRFVILPQAARRLLPPLVSLLVNIIQNTTIAQVIGAAELLETGERSAERLTFTTPRVARARDLRCGRRGLLPDLVPAHAPRGAPREAPDLASNGERACPRPRPCGGAGSRRCPDRTSRSRPGRSRGGAARRPEQQCGRRPGQ